MVFADTGPSGADGDGDKLKKNRFLSTTKEVEDLNQYWYSNRTISAMARDVEDVCAAPETRAAFLSTPSVYFSLSNEVRARSLCFDLDTQWQKEPGYVCYDFNKPIDFEGAEELKGHVRHGDHRPAANSPVRLALNKYTETARWLLKPGGHVMASTIRRTRRS